MSRVIPVPPKNLKKKPPPPKPQINFAVVSSTVDEPEQERAEKMSPTQPIQDIASSTAEPIAPPAQSPIEIQKEEQAPAPQEIIETVLEVPTLTLIPKQKPPAPPAPKARRPPPPQPARPPIIQKQQKQPEQEPAGGENGQKIQDTKPQPDPELEALNEVKIQTVVQPQPQQKPFEQPIQQQQDAVIDVKIETSKKAPLPPVKPAAKKPKAPPPPVKSKPLPPSSPRQSLTPIDDQAIPNNAEMTVDPIQQIVTEKSISKQVLKEEKIDLSPAFEKPQQKVKIEDPPKQQVKAVKEQAKIELPPTKPVKKPEEPIKEVIKPVPQTLPPPQPPVQAQATPAKLPVQPPKSTKIQEKVSKAPPASVDSSAAKSSISAKLEELRRAKEQMLNDDSEQEDYEGQQSEPQGVPDPVSEEAEVEAAPLKSVEPPLIQPAPIVSAPKPKPVSIPKSPQIVPETEVKVQHAIPQVPKSLQEKVQAPRTNLAPPKAARAPPAPAKRIAPPPAIKNVPKPPEVKIEPLKNQYPEEQASEEPAEEQKNSENVQSVNEGKLPASRAVEPPAEVHPAPFASPQPPVEQKKEQKFAPVDRKPQVRVNAVVQDQGSSELSSLLERYHALKTGYLNNLRELDELIHFQRQQEDSEIEKINHLLADLHKRNDAIKQICSVKELPSPSEHEELAI